MGESGVMTVLREHAQEEPLAERFKIFDTEQPGGSESEDDSSGDGNGDEIIYHGGPDDPGESDPSDK